MDWDLLVRFQRETRHQGRQKQDSGRHGNDPSENQAGDPQGRKQVAETDKTRAKSGSAISYVN